MYILTFYSVSSSCGQLFEHLCLFWTLTAYERSAPTLDLTFSPLVTPRGSPLPASPDPACQDTPSPILRLPKPCSTVSSNGNFKPPSHCSVEKKRSTSRTQSIQSAASLASLRHQNAAPNPPIGPRAAKVTQHLPVVLCSSRVWITVKDFYWVTGQCSVEYLVLVISNWTSLVRGKEFPGI